MIKCRYCQSEIDEKAKVCPQCGRTLKGPTPAAAVVLIILAIAIGKPMLDGFMRAKQANKENIPNANITTTAPTSTTAHKSSAISYQSILDDYSSKLEQATPSLISAYKNEVAKSSGSIEELAKICNNKTMELAKISNEGVGKMADLMLSSNDSYSNYEDWASKLQDVYVKEAEKISDAYLDSAT